MGQHSRKLDHLGAVIDCSGLDYRKAMTAQGFADKLKAAR
jgi:hypothetical protein